MKRVTVVRRAVVAKCQTSFNLDLPLRTGWPSDVLSIANEAPPNLSTCSRWRETWWGECLGYDFELGMRKGWGIMVKLKGKTERKWENNEVMYYKGQVLIETWAIIKASDVTKLKWKVRGDHQEWRVNMYECWGGNNPDCGEVPCFLFIMVYPFLHYLSTDTLTYCQGLPHFVSFLSYLTLSYLIPQCSVTFRFFLTWLMVDIACDPPVYI